jgi:hypothetical protein
VPIQNKPSIKNISLPIFKMLVTSSLGRNILLKIIAKIKNKIKRGNLVISA